MEKSGYSRKVTPKKAVELFNLNALSISEDQAKLILDFLYGIASIAVKHFLKNEDR